MKMLNKDTNELDNYIQRGRVVLVVGLIWLVATSAGYASASVTGYMQQVPDTIKKFVLNEKVANSQRRVSLKLDNVSLSSALQVLAKKARVGLSLQAQVISDKKVTIDVNETSVYEVLDILLKGTGLEAVLSSSRDVLVIRQKLNQGFKMQLETVQGTVTDGQSGETLPGVNILVKGTNSGTSTDIDGNYELSVSSFQDTLIFTYVGYQSREVSINGRSTINITMQQQVLTGKELVVTGYGTQKKSDLTGSVTSVSGEELSQPSVSSFDQMLQGKVAGVQVHQTSGAPGGNVNILVRGVSSITGGNQPLYVIDGFPIGSGGTSDMSGYSSSLYSSSGIASNTRRRVNPLAFINPSDIKSIDILKDASATAIYGSRGANGVVIIETKRGSTGISQINVEASSGFQQVANKIDVMNAQQYAKYVARARDNTWLFAGGSKDDPNDVRSAATRVRSSFRNPESISTNTDWQDVVFRAAPVRNLQLSTMGGTEKTKYYIGGGYYSQEGTILTSNYNRFNFRVNVDAQLNDKLKVGTSSSGSYGFGRFTNTSGHYGNGGILSMVLAASPTIPVYDESGDYYFNYDDVVDGLGWLANPLSVLHGTSDRRKVMNIFSNNFIEYNITDNLALRSSIGVNFLNRNIRLWRSSAVPHFTSLNYPSNAGLNRIQSLNWLNENTFSYNKEFSGKHKIKGVVGFTEQKDTRDIATAGASSFPTDYVHLISAGVVNAGNQSIGEWSILSFLARINYSYKDKYLITATVRRDGSSKFGKNNKWGTFPSLALGYRISEEPFLKGNKVISNLKFRASYGITGNDQIGNYSQIGLMAPTGYIQNNSLIGGLVPSSLSNNDLTWEKSKQINFGIDLGLFGDRFSLTADIYRDLKTNLLLAVQLPAASGFNSSIQNIGEVENKGIELKLNTTNVVSRNFEWSSNITFSANRNKVRKLATNRITNNDYQITQIGDPIASFYLLNKLGVFQNEEEVERFALYNPKTQPGDLKFEDVNGDGVITQDDRKVVGDPWPDFTWGLDNTFSFKNLNLYISLVGSQGAYKYFKIGETILNSAGVQNQLAISLNRWESESNPGKFPRPIRNNYAYGFGRRSTQLLFDASFIRIRDIKLSYSLPVTLTSRLNMKNLVIYADITNVHTFTDYPGYDPEETTAGGNVVGSGIDDFSYPLARTLTFGFKLSL